jgi:hypothetical protein
MLKKISHLIIEDLYRKKFGRDDGGIRDKEIYNTLVMNGPSFMNGKIIEETVSIIFIVSIIMKIFRIKINTQG